MYNSIVIHYSEIGTKGKNRAFFENRLVKNINKAIEKEAYRRYGRIICELDKKEGLEKIKQILERLPGIANFSFAVKTTLDLKSIKADSIKLLKEEKFKTFKVDTKRSNKKFKLTSQQLNCELGDHIITKLKKKVDVKTPELRLYIEIGEKEALLFCKKYQGVSGLPVGVSGKIACSLSGGIDSPVSAFLLMKRGCEIVFVHVHNTTVSRGILSKLDDLVKQLTKFQLNSKIYIVPFEKIQQEIIANVPAKFRMIIYRRFMMKIINEISKTEKIKGIITGDSIGQVASQTIENITCIYSAAELPILAPLIGMNKEEIVDIAKKIGTYEYSIQPYPDCCSFMIAKHPETRAKLSEIETIEKNIKRQKMLISDSIKRAEIKRFKF